MNYVNVIVVKAGVVEENHLFMGENAAHEAERCFFDMCSTHVSNWDEYDGSDMDAILEQGYEKFGSGSICINWPSNTGRKFATCDDCETAWGMDELMTTFPDIPDLIERINPGETVPAGECPQCGALVHRLNTD